MVFFVGRWNILDGMDTVGNFWMDLGNVFCWMFDDHFWDYWVNFLVPHTSNCSLKVAPNWPPYCQSVQCYIIFDPSEFQDPYETYLVQFFFKENFLKKCTVFHQFIITSNKNHENILLILLGQPKNNKKSKALVWDLVIFERHGNSVWFLSWFKSN